MGYGSYEVRDRGWAGYAHDDVCHQEDCSEEIDRGLSYLCGTDPHSPDPGCGWWFCGKHLFYTDSPGQQLCPGCLELWEALSEEEREDVL